MFQQEREEQKFLWALQNSFSKSVSTVAMDFRSFNKTVSLLWYQFIVVMIWKNVTINNSIQIADTFENAVNPLFVLLHDNEISQQHLTWVSEWMVMSTYSTWLLFIEETTSIESFFKDVYVSIDSNFIVSQQKLNSSEEEVTCVYHIEKSDLQVKKFASLTEQSGLAEFTQVLDEKAKNFYGKVMKICFYEVKPTI